jgi:hypothetical protein
MDGWTKRKPENQKILRLFSETDESERARWRSDTADCKKTK